MHGDLIAKLEALDGPSREVDGGVWCAVNAYAVIQRAALTEGKDE